MPSYTRGQLRENLKFVKVHDGPLYYGFKAKDFGGLPGISEGDVKALGWLDPTQVPDASVGVLRANSPKPQRVKKVLVRYPNANQQGSASTFCAHTAFATAQAAGWNLIGGPRRIKITNTGRTKTMGAKLPGNGGVYLFPLNATDANNYGADLGLIAPQSMNGAERDRAFSGSSYPRPAKMGKIVNTATGSQFRTFVSFDKEDDALKAGYQYLRAGTLSPLPSAPPPENP